MEVFVSFTFKKMFVRQYGMMSCKVVPKMDNKLTLRDIVRDIKTELEHDLKAKDVEILSINIQEEGAE